MAASRPLSLMVPTPEIPDTLPLNPEEGSQTEPIVKHQRF
jgi:hypothetical protein